MGQLASETQIITAYIDEEISGHLIACAYRQKRLVGFFTTEVHQGSSVIFHIPEQADEVCFFLWDAEIKMLPLQNKITFLRST
ncbi:hypothetical protein [Ructibacterium gallinarum]|uniref:Uncharacterized protein n=1 Tax=Ructibacterium gallinarum TaxID=2779355 RepID=A0A9D5M7F5_9FIRM|nr:hypothetical protein [Ructibacterium gallinarum]MBE5040939.1 hypothetical protein [Ructibacterium gallinarum]